MNYQEMGYEDLLEDLRTPHLRGAGYLGTLWRRPSTVGGEELVRAGYYVRIEGGPYPYLYLLQVALDAAWRVIEEGHVVEVDRPGEAPPAPERQLEWRAYAAPEWLEKT